MVAAAAAATVAAVVLAAPSGPLQHAFAETTSTPINPGAAGNITDDDHLHLHEIYEIATFELAGRTYAAVLSAEGVQVLDLTDPHDVIPAGQIADDDRPDLLGRMRNIATFELADRTYAAVVTSQVVQVLNLTDPYNISRASRTVHDGYQYVISDIAAFELAGRTYAAVASFQGVQLLDLTDPHDIVPAGQIADDDSLYLDSPKGIITIELFGRTYAAVASVAGVQLLDLTDPHDIVPAGQIADDDSLYLGYPEDIITIELFGRTYAAVLSAEGVQVLDLTDPHDVIPAGQIGSFISSSITTFKSDGRAYAAFAIYDDVQVIQLTGDITNRATYVDDQNNVPVDLVITTHNPLCTAVNLNYLEVTRLTDIQPGYPPANFTSGINVTAVIWTHDANATIPAILRPEVSSVAMYSHVVHNATANATSLEQPELLRLDTNPDVVIPVFGQSPCDSGAWFLMDMVDLEGAGPGAGPTGIPPGNRTEPEPDGPTGIAGAGGDEPEPLMLDPKPAHTHADPVWGTHYYGDLMKVSIRTHGNAATDVWRYLKDNGAIVYHVYPHESVDRLSAYVPPSVLWPLSIRDDIRKINPIGDPFQEQYGSIGTEGLPDVHPNVEGWHGIGHNDAGIESAHTPVSLVVTTHNPACTAVHLDYLGVTRLTDVRPWYRNGTLGYTHDEITNGVNVTAVIWARDSNMTIPSILERPEVSRILTYSYVAPNSTDAPILLAQANNTDVVRPGAIRLPTECGNIRPHMLLFLMDAVGWDGAEPGTGPRGAIPANGTEPESGGPAAAKPPPLTLDPWPETRVDPESGIIYAGDLMGVTIRTSNHTAVWAFLKENGALVTHAKPQIVSGYIPTSILWPLSIRGDIYSINEAVQSEYMLLYGNTTTEGLLDVNHPNVGQWHGIGHNDAGIESAHTPMILVVTTHNPGCTAVHLDYLGVTRLTDVRPWYRNGTLGYTHDEITNGVNVTAVIWARDSNMTIPSILERPEVSSVATYSYVASNSTETPALLAQANNTGVIWPDM